MSGERYLNTPKKEKCVIKETEPFDTPLPEQDDLPLLTTETMTVSILGVASIKKYHSCFHYNKKTLATSVPTNMYCEQCKMKIKLVNCEAQSFICDCLCVMLMTPTNTCCVYKSCKYVS